VFRAAAGKFAIGIGTAATVRQAWRRLPAALQQRAIVISQEQGFEEYFNPLVGQVPELT
jgi:hypothetical protein